MMRMSLLILLFALPTACGGGGGEPPVQGQGVDPDTTPPVTTAAPEGGDFDRAVEVELTTSEPARVHVSIDGGDFEDRGEAPVRIPLGEGTTTIRYFAEDLAGNVEDPVSSQRYFIDLSPPQLTLPAGDPEPVPWLAAAAVEWQADEEVDYNVTVVETGELLDEGELAAGATATVAYEGVDLPDEPITVRIEATDWTGRSSTLEFVLERAAPAVLSVTDEPGSVVVLPAGDRAFVARRFGTEVDVIDLATEAIVDTIDVGIRAWTVTLNADASSLYVSNGVSPGAIAVVDVDTYDVEDVDADVGIPGAVAFSPDGAFGFFTDFDGNVLVLGTDPAGADYLAVVDEIFVNDDALTGRGWIDPDNDTLVLNWGGVSSVGVSVVEFGASGPDVRTAWLSSVPPVNAQSQAIRGAASGASAFITSVKLLCGLCRFDLEEDRLVHAGDDPDPAPDAVITINGKPVPDLPWSLALIDGDDRLLTAGPNGRYLRLFETATMAHRSRHRVGAGAASIGTDAGTTLAVVSRASGSDREILILPLR